MTDLALILPEATLLALACAVLLIDAFVGRRTPDATFWAAVVTCVVVLAQVARFVPEKTLFAYAGTLRIDVLGVVLKTFVVSLVLLSFFYAREHFSRRPSSLRGEYYPLALFAMLGMMILVSASSLLTVYLGLELLSLSMYSMVAIQRDSLPASEAAMKYFILGALASGLLLYGMSMLYGVAGTLDLTELLVKVNNLESQSLLLTFGLVFMVVGIAFKLGVVPFHMWVPDVYQGAATPVTQFIGTAPKVAAFGMTMRLLVDGLEGLAEHWQQMLVVLSVLSMGVGNLLAIAQTNFKRMLAYSTIAHMGFLLLGLVASNAAGYAASMFYVSVYALMSMGAFGAIILLSTRDSDAEQISDLAGLGRRNPWFALILLILMFSMAGVPPFGGFWAKWSVLKEVIAADYVWLAGLAVLFSLIGAFFYLRIVKVMYFDEPNDAPTGTASADLKLILSVNGLAVLGVGLMPNALMAVCLSATVPYGP